MQHEIACGPYHLDFKKKTFVMGILNATPDSFSDGGLYDEREKAVSRAKQMVQDGADLIDIGGESTRPGHTPVSIENEIKRVVPLIQEISQTVNIPLSIDTYKAETADAAIRAGAHLINDIWGAKKNPEIATVAATHKVPIILMHNRENKQYDSFVRDVLNDLYESITIAKKAGVEDNQIILDPGIGFAKGFKEDMEILRHIDEIIALGYPVLLALSRKRLIGSVLNLPVDERVEGTIAANCYGIEKGCHMVRVHDVKQMSRAAKMTDVIIGKGKLDGQDLYK